MSGTADFERAALRDGDVLLSIYIYRLSACLSVRLSSETCRLRLLLQNGGHHPYVSSTVKFRLRALAITKLKVWALVIAPLT